MAGRNISSLLRVYVKAELLFAKLANVLERYECWVTLYDIGDPDFLIENCCESSISYDINFKAVQNKRREAEKLADSIKVDCISINLAPLKSRLEEHFQRVHDALLLILKRTMVDDIKQVTRKRDC